MNWFINLLQKEARRFGPGHAVRYYKSPQKGTGKGVVHTPSFSKGRVVDYDSTSRRYKIWDDSLGQEVQVHPRNLVPDSISTMTTTTETGMSNENIS